MLIGDRSFIYHNYVLCVPLISLSERLGNLKMEVMGSSTFSFRRFAPNGAGSLLKWVMVSSTKHALYLYRRARIILPYP